MCPQLPPGTLPPDISIPGDVIAEAITDPARIYKTSRLLPGRVHLPIQPATTKNRGKLFFRLVQQAVAVEPVPLDRILHPGAKPKTKPQSVGAT
jgi:hypothetical protein